MSNDDLQKKLHDFITTELRPGAKVGADDSLLEGGILDSMAIMRLNEFIEDKLGVALDDADFEPEHYETITTIVALVERTKGS